MYALKSPSWLNRSFNVSSIAFLQMSIGIMVGICGLSSYVIWVGDGVGGVETKSTMFSPIEVVVLFTFFGRTCFAPTSTNHLNCVSTNTLFVVASYMISTELASISSSSSDSEMITLHFPFPYS